MTGTEPRLAWTCARKASCPLFISIGPIFSTCYILFISLFVIHYLYVLSTFMPIYLSNYQPQLLTILFSESLLCTYKYSRTAFGNGTIHSFYLLYI